MPTSIMLAKLRELDPCGIYEEVMSRTVARYGRFHRPLCALALRQWCFESHPVTEEASLCDHDPVVNTEPMPVMSCNDT